jgi:hypothetical protein
VIKYEEICDPDSCWNKADYDERLFVLLARDVTTPKTIRFWITERIKAGKNKPDDHQIRSAEKLADLIEAELKVKGKL